MIFSHFPLQALSAILFFHVDFGLVFEQSIPALVHFLIDSIFFPPSFYNMGFFLDLMKETQNLYEKSYLFPSRQIFAKMNNGLSRLTERSRKNESSLS